MGSSLAASLLAIALASVLKSIIQATAEKGKCVNAANDWMATQ